MRKILVVVMIAAVMVLAFSVAAMAKPSEPANEWGQYHKFINTLDPSGYENWGQLVKLYKEYIKAGYYEPYDVYTWGDFVAWTKTLDLPQP